MVTGSSGHLGEGLVKHLKQQGHHVIGYDLLPSADTDVVGNLLDETLLDHIMTGIEVVFHTATLHKPHIISHSAHAFLMNNVMATEVLLRIAVKHQIKAFIFTSTTSSFGEALAPKSQTAASWIDEKTQPIPKNIYGVSKIMAENLCQLAYKEHGLPCIILKTSRFFPEADDMSHTMPEYTQDNLKAIEFLYRRVDLSDVVKAHEKAMHHAPEIGFDQFIISATTPFSRDDCSSLLKHAPQVLASYYPNYEAVFKKLHWQMFPSIDRVYCNRKARTTLGWEPKYDFKTVLGNLSQNKPLLSTFAYEIGEKGYHRKV